MSLIDLVLGLLVTVAVLSDISTVLRRLKFMVSFLVKVSTLKPDFMVDVEYFTVLAHYDLFNQQYSR